MATYCKDVLITYRFGIPDCKSAPITYNLFVDGLIANIFCLRKQSNVGTLK